MGNIVLKPGKERSLLNKHPWVFSGAIKKAPSNLNAGDTVSILSSKGDFLARAYYNPASQIRGRVFSWTKGQHLDREYLKYQIESSVHRRSHIDKTKTNCIRLVAHDADFLPGLVIDQYGDWIVFQILTAGMEVLRNVIIEVIKEIFSPAGIVERSDESIRKKEGLEPRKELIHGDIPDQGVPVLENGMKLLVDVWEGHKTGFYIDQRDSRDIVRQYSQGCRVLNCFSYTGGFSIAAGIGGATEVISVDESQPALDIAEKNWQNNQITAKGRFHRADVFKYLRELKEKGEKFDFIIMDPPKFASSQKNVNGACRGYKDLNLLAWHLLNPDGILATFSCSGLISRDLFQKVIFGSTVDAGCDAQIIKHLSQAEDHPTRMSFPESLYLKGFLLRKV